MIKEKSEIGLFKGQLDLDRWFPSQAKLDDFSEKNLPKYKVGQRVLFNDKICTIESDEMSYSFVDLREDLKKAITRRDIEIIWIKVQRDMKS